MDHYSYYQIFNHPHDAQHSEAPVPHLPPPNCNPPAPAPAPTLEPTVYPPASPSDFIYNSANTTASIFYPSRTSHPSHSWFSNEPASTLLYTQAMGYGPSRPVELSLSTYLPSLPRHSLTESTTGLLELNSGRSSLRGAHLPERSLPESNLPEPVAGFEEHRRQQKSKMNMGPGSSKSVPPPLDLNRERPSVRGSNSSSSDSTVVIKRENFSSSPIPVSVPTNMKEWEPKILAEEKRKERIDSFDNGTTGTVSEMGSGSENGIWEDRGESVMEKIPVMPPVVPNFETNSNMGFGMGMGMQPPILPKLGLFKTINWDDPSSRLRVMRRRMDRAWGIEHEASGQTYSGQSGNESGYRNGNEETDDEHPSSAHISSSYSRSAKKLKLSVEGDDFRTGSTETVIKQEPGLSPSPRTTFSQIPMYNYNGVINNTTGPGYGSSGDDNHRSSRSISPLTRVPTPRRLLFPTRTIDRTEAGTGTGIGNGIGITSQSSLKGVSRQLKKRTREMASLSREKSRERSRERSGEDFWNLASGSQNHSAEPPQEQHRGYSEEREQDWATISVSGSSEEDEVSSHHENSYGSYSCGQGRDTSPPRNTHQSSPFLSYRDQNQECYSQASTSSPPIQGPASSSSARYSPDSAPSLSVEQQRVEQYRQAIQMVQDTCLEASKRYMRAHCVNMGVRGGGEIPYTNPVSREGVESRSARKARRRRKLKTRQPSLSSSSASSSPSPSRRRKGKRQAQNQKRTTITPSSSPFSPSSSHPKPHDEIHLTDSLLPNISQICTLLWSRSQSLRLHDISSIELSTARNMYWLLSWAETVAFAVPPTTPFSSSTSNNTSISSPLHGFGESSLENLAAGRRWEWRRPVSSFAYQREREERDPEHAISMWDTLDESLGEGVYMWRMKTDEEGGGVDTRGSRNGAVWRQQVEEIERVFEAGGAVCEFLGYGEGVERISRVRGFYGL